MRTRPPSGSHPRRRPRRRAPRPGAQAAPTVVELTLGEPVHGGACIAREPSGRAVFVRLGLPGERVRARITAQRARMAWADVVEVLEPSPDRVPSAWPEAGADGVGGAELAHVRPAAQRRWKAHVIEGQLRRVGGRRLAEEIAALGELRVLPAPGDEDPDDPLLHRRSRIELIADRTGRAGMHRYRDRAVLAIRAMPLAAQELGRLGLLGDSPWCSLWRPGQRIRAVAANADQPVVVTPHGAFGPDRAPRRDPRVRWRVRVGDEEREFRVHAGGFWQTHRRGADVLATAVRELAQVEGGERVLELYSGAGLYTRFLAEDAGADGRVLSLEGSRDAVADAWDNLEGLGQAETFQGDVDVRGVRELAANVASYGVPDVVVLDPPRSGAGLEVCQAIAQSGARRVVLVACDPAAGARDLRTLRDAGYRIDALRAWDLFPHTHHVEFVARARRGGR